MRFGSVHRDGVIIIYSNIIIRFYFEIIIYFHDYDKNEIQTHWKRLFKFNKI